MARVSVNRATSRSRALHAGEAEPLCPGRGVLPCARPSTCSALPNPLRNPLLQAALGVNSALFTFSFVVFNFLATATTPLVAAALAQGDSEKVSALPAAARGVHWQNQASDSRGIAARG